MNRRASFHELAEFELNDAAGVSDGFIEAPRNLQAPEDIVVSNAPLRRQFFCPAEMLQRLVAERWAVIDADGALRHALANPNRDTQIVLMKEAARVLVRRSGANAIAAISQMPSLLERRLFGRFSTVA